MHTGVLVLDERDIAAALMERDVAVIHDALLGPLRGADWRLPDAVAALVHRALRLPADYTVLRVWPEYYVRRYMVAVEHESLPDTPDGQYPPQLWPVYERQDDGEVRMTEVQVLPWAASSGYRLHDQFSQCCPMCLGYVTAPCVEGIRANCLCGKLPTVVTFDSETQQWWLKPLPVATQPA